MGKQARLVLDVFLSVLFLGACYPAATGFGLHEWLGVTLIVPALIHCIVNWDWTVRTLTRFADKIRAASRLNLLVDTALFVATVAVTVSGFAVSRTLASLAGIETAVDIQWHVLHAVSADAVLALFALHAALHGKWIASAVADLFTEVRQPLPAPAAQRVSPVAANPRGPRTQGHRR